MTETGYHNGVNGTVGHQPVSEAAAAIYMPRLFLDDFRRGITRSFSYELLDQREDPAKTDIEAAFGLLRNDFSKKPAAVAIERLTGLLADRGPRFVPGALEYSLEGAPPSAEQLLLQKRDGNFYLVLWNRVSVWEQETRSDLSPPAVPITVDFEQPMASAEVFEPNVAATAVATTTSPGQLALELSPRVSVIKLTPRPTPPSEPTPAPPAEPAPRPVAPVTPAPAPKPVARSVTAPTVPPAVQGSVPNAPAAPAAPAAGPPESQVWIPPQRQGQKKKSKGKKGHKHRHRQHRQHRSPR